MKMIVRLSCALGVLCAVAGFAASEDGDRGHKRVSSKAELLPALTGAGDENRAAVFSNAVYSAWLTTAGYLQVTLLNDGRPAGPSFDLFTPHFRGSEEKGGFVVYQELDNLKAESKLPARQPTSSVRFRVDAEFGARMSVSIDFAERSIGVEVKFRPSAKGETTVAHPSAWFFALPGFSRRVEKDLTPELQAVCEEKYVDLVPEKDSPMSLHFAEDVKDFELLRAKEWTVRGLWDGYAVRGRTSTRGFQFRYSQYMGTKPAQGFRMFYSLGRGPESVKTVFEFVPYDKPVVGMDEATPREPKRR